VHLTPPVARHEIKIKTVQMELAPNPINLSISQWEITHPLSLTARISASSSIAAINICLAHLVTTQAGIYVSHIPSLSYSANAGGFSSNCELALYRPGITWQYRGMGCNDGFRQLAVVISLRTDSLSCGSVPVGSLSRTSVPSPSDGSLQVRPRSKSVRSPFACCFLFAA
jgi:hypothetical protein